MKQELGGIVHFESRVEVSEVLAALEDWRKACDKNRSNQAVKELVGILDVMYMTW